MRAPELKFRELGTFTKPLADKTAFLSQVIDTQHDVTGVQLDSHTVMQMIVERTQNLTRADGAALELIEGSQMVCRAGSGSASDLTGGSRPTTKSMTARCALNGKLYHCTDALVDPHVDRSACRRRGVRSMVLAPLTYGGKNAGVLKIVSSKPNAFTDESISGLQLMAGLLGAALDHAAEFEIKKNLLDERTVALTALRESERRFRTAFDNAAIGKALVGLDGRWIQVNRSLSRILGYTETELLATNFQSLTHPDDLDADLNLIRQLIASEIETYQMTKRYIHKLGHTVWALLNVSLVRDEAEKPLYFISQIQDMSQRHSIEESLRLSEEEHRAIFELAGVGKVQVDLATGNLLRVNKKFCDMLRYSPEEALGLTFDQIAVADDRAAIREVADAMMAGKLTDHTLEKRYQRKNGEVIWVSINAAIIRDPSGKPSRAVATINEITQRKHTEWLESDRRKVLEAVVQNRPLRETLLQLSQTMQRQVAGSVATLMLIGEGNISIVNSVLPVPLREALNKSALPLSIKLAAGAWSDPDTCGVTFIETDAIWENVRQIAADLSLRVCWAVPIQATDGSSLGLVMVFAPDARRPIAGEMEALDSVAKLATLCIEHHNTNNQLAHLVHHDALTGTANRLMFEDRLDEALSLSRTTATSVGLCMLDLDRFKIINDSFGHQVGDHLLQLFAHRVRTCIREEDTLARLGGDEFAIVLPNLTNSDGAVVVAKRILKALEEPFSLPDCRPLRVTTSIGIAISSPPPLQTLDAATLREAADAALYRVKAENRDGFSF